MRPDRLVSCDFRPPARGSGHEICDCARSWRAVVSSCRALNLVSIGKRMAPLPCRRVHACHAGSCGHAPALVLPLLLVHLFLPFDTSLKHFLCYLELIWPPWCYKHCWVGLCKHLFVGQTDLCMDCSNCFLLMQAGFHFIGVHYTYGSHTFFMPLKQVTLALLVLFTIPPLLALTFPTYFLSLFWPVSW